MKCSRTFTVRANLANWLAQAQAKLPSIRRRRTKPQKTGRCRYLNNPTMIRRLRRAGPRNSKRRRHRNLEVEPRAESFHLLVERRAIDAQLVGRGVAVPVVRFQHVANDLALGAFERFLERLLP